MIKASLLFLLFSVFSFGQKFTDAETARIEDGDIETAMTVFQTSDSLQHFVLLDQSADVDPKNKHTKILVNRMKLALVSTDGGVGIAAPQVGINRNIIWVKRFDQPGNPLECLINPKILWHSEILALGPEGDLSIEDFRDYFYRSQVILVEYDDLEGKKITGIVEGFTAVIIQHETDHLSGILISDKIKNQKSKTFEKAEFYREIPKF